MRARSGPRQDEAVALIRIPVGWSYDNHQSEWFAQHSLSLINKPVFLVSGISDTAADIQSKTQ